MNKLMPSIPQRDHAKPQQDMNMNDTNPNTGSVPPQIAAAHSTAPGPRPLGENPEERVPISSLVSAIEAILRQPRRVMYQLRQLESGG